MVNCTHGLRRQTIVQSILHGIFAGRYHSGQRLVVQKLADEFGVSPTPIREALVELSGIGIVDLLPNRGAVVRSVTRNDVAELCQIRRVLESEAARCAAEQVDRVELESLLIELRRLVKLGQSKSIDGVPFIEQTRAADSRLHDLIAHCCGSRRLAEAIGQFKLLFRAFRDVGYARFEERNDFTRMAEENEEHLAIAEALEAGDGKAASKAMSKHIDAAVKHWGQLIVDALTEPKSRRRRPPAPQPKQLP
ncbi:MAG: GntR family transcriptional regulator [Planctomycetaceae bacterium]|nr:GntR family transcriptional regulator [Planctomycetaceae bacterium]